MERNGSHEEVVAPVPWLRAEGRRSRRWDPGTLPKSSALRCVAAAIGALSAWSLRGATISNLQSQVDLLRVRLEVGSESSPPFPLPEYSLGGSEFGTLSSDEWVNPTTARRIELDWGGLGGVDVQAVLRMRAPVPQRAQGSDSAWVETRILNVTDGEVVATSERHSGSWIVTRVPLPRATGVKTYSIQLRGQRAGFLGVIELRRATGQPTRR